jgi:hypothetical protein
MNALAQVATRQQHQHDAIDAAARQTIVVAQAVQALAERIADQQRMLDEVHHTTGRIDRLLRPFLRLRARLFRRSPES